MNTLKSRFEFQNPVNSRKKVVKTVAPISDYKKGFKDQYNKDSAPVSSASPSTPVKSPSTQTPSQHIKISVRLPRGIVTSLTLKKNIIAIWMLYRTPLESDPEKVCDLIEDAMPVKEDTIKEMATRFVYRCIDKWDHDTGKGLSDFVTELMIEDALEMEDHAIYQMIMSYTKA